MTDKMPAQNEPINVNFGVMVMIPITHYEALRNVEADKERYAQHIADHQRNLSAAELKIKSLEEKLTAYGSISDELKELKERNHANSERVQELKESNSKLSEKVGNAIPAKRSHSKKK